MKTKKRFLIFLFCFMFLFCVGCPEGGPSDFADENTPLSMEGVKVLSKPADYNFKEAVGDAYSENYYNLFAKEILEALYHVYEDDSVEVEFKNEEEVFRTKIYKDLDTDNGATFPLKVDENKKPINPDISEREHYLFDTLRYTIIGVETIKDEDGDLISQTLNVQNNAWLWTIENEKFFNEKSIFFKNLQSQSELTSAISISSQQVTFDFGKLASLNFDDWTGFYSRSPYKELSPNFSEFYVYPDGQVKVGGTENTDYWISPYYNEAKGLNLTGEAAPVNFFQDALEYATYLFVLGFDYNADAADVPYFDFEVVYDTNGLVSDVKVGGWGNDKISVSKGGENSALGKVKKMYQELGGYVGITRYDGSMSDEEKAKTNQGQIEQFVIDKIIGEKAYEKDKFDVALVEKDENGIVKSTSKQNYNRNYDKIISNIVEYACTQAPIGVSSEDQTLTLDQNFLASQITDYKGNYFGASKKDNKDDNMFEFIPAAEYQSIVIYPNEEDFDKNAEKNLLQTIGDIWLAFEYWDDPRDTITPEEDKLKERDKENGLIINVGFRYFDHEKGQFTANESVQKHVSYGQFPEYYNPDGSKNQTFEEEFENHVASFCDTGTGTDKAIGNVPIKTKFKYDIGGGAIDPFANGTEIEGQETKSILIQSGNRAKDFYMTNASSSYGVFGTLNPDKFKGEDGCDYIEVYFDVVKTKGVVGKNYNFKVALYNFLAAEDVYAQN